MLINGRWQAGEKNEKLKVLDKYTGEEMATVPIATRGDVTHATESAQRAFATWSKTPAHQRAKILRHTADLLEKRRETLAATLSREAGKAWKHALGEVDRSV